MPTIGYNPTLNKNVPRTAIGDKSPVTPINQFVDPTLSHGESWNSANIDNLSVVNPTVAPTSIDNRPMVSTANAPRTDKPLANVANFLKQGTKNVGAFLKDNQSGIEQGLAFAAPIMANVASQNAANAAYKKIDALQPKQFTSTPIDTRVDTSSAVNNINQSVNQQIKGAGQAFSDPTTSQAYAAKLTADKIPALANIQTGANQTSAQLKAMNAQSSDRTSQMNVDQTNKYDQMKAEAFGNLMGVKSSIGQAHAQSLLNLIKEKNTNHAYDSLMRELYASMDSSGGMNLQHLGKDSKALLKGAVETPKTK